MSNKDEHYVIDLCDKVLGLKAERQKTFDFLRGDPGKKTGHCSKLPVDAYYEPLNLIIEYRELSTRNQFRFSIDGKRVVVVIAESSDNDMMSDDETFSRNTAFA